MERRSCPGHHVLTLAVAVSIAQQAGYLWLITTDQYRYVPLPTALHPGAPPALA